MPNLGIDFGTSTTRVAIRNEGEPPIAIPIGDLATDFIPSVVAIRKELTSAKIAAVGSEALAMSGLPDVFLLENVKRSLMYAVRPSDRVKIPSWWDPARNTINVWGHAFTPNEIILAILNEALARAARQSRLLGIPLDEVVIRNLPVSLGCPADNGFGVRAELVQIAQSLGFKGLCVDDIVDEPALAAVALASLRELNPGDVLATHRTVLVYDLGGGTFDVALVDVEPGVGPSKLTVQASASRLIGGADIDRALLVHLKPRIAAELGLEVDDLDVVLDSQDWARLQSASREVKEELSISEAAFFTAALVSSGSILSIPVTRELLNGVIADTQIIGWTLDCTMEAYRQSRMYREGGGGFFTKLPGGQLRSLSGEGMEELRKNVTDIVIVGGTTRIPLVWNKLEEAFGTDKVVSPTFVDPITAIAIGAAVVRDGYLPASLESCRYEIGIKDEAGKWLILHKPHDRYLSYNFPMGVPTPRLESTRIELEAGKTYCLRAVTAKVDSFAEMRFESPATGEGIFSFDDLGAVRITLGNNVIAQMETPPWQHKLQGRIHQSRIDQAQEKAAEELRRAQRNVNRPAWTDTN